MAQKVVVTAISANTSLGDAVTACAAARALLCRPAPLERLVFDPEEGPVPLVGIPVPTVAGFQGEARLLSLALPALRDLTRSEGFDSKAELGFFLALPDLQSRAKAAGSSAPPSLRLVDRLVEMTGLAAPPALRRSFPAGHVGFALAVQAAMELFEQGDSNACIVGGVDSLCDDLAIDALSEQARLKSGENPVGLIPGEAAAFLLLETPDWARRRGAKALAQINGVGLAEDTRAQGGQGPIGQGLFKAIRQLAKNGGSLPVGETFFLLDRNGEASRANDWGYCQQRLTTHMRDLLPASEWDPALNFGDTGAASGVLATQVALRAFARGYAAGRCAVVLSASDGGMRGAVRIEMGS